MCERHIYTHVNSLGQVEKSHTTRLCSNSRRERPCEYTTDFKHPDNEPRPDHMGTRYYNMPPSPPSSVHYHSGNDTGHSRKKNTGVYINGLKVLDIDSKYSHRSKRNQVDERYLILDPPAHSPASSYEADYSTYEPQRQYPSHSRPEVRVEVNSHRPKRRSTYVPKSILKNSSRDSGSVPDEQRRYHKAQHEFSEAEKPWRHQKELDAEIRRANEAIKSRPAVPAHPQPKIYRRGSVAVEDGVADALRQLHLSNATIADAEEERHRQFELAEERRRQKEEDAQRRRLADRLNPHPVPQRRASIAVPRPRQKVVHEYGRTLYY